jgi:hypothetical protein
MELCVVFQQATAAAFAFNRKAAFTLNSKGACI